MNDDTTMVNDRKKRMAIFQSLLAVEIHASFTKTQEELAGELKQLEKEGKLKIYHPEGGNQ